MPLAVSTSPPPEFVGFGAVSTTGGAGGTVYTVSNLNNSGTGSFREAATATGARIIRFTGLEGTITLTSEVELRGNVTIEGDTADGDGIVITGDRIQVVEGNVIIQHLKIRQDGLTAALDCLSVGNSNGGALVQHVIVDHCSFSGATDENLALWGPVSDITVSNCIIAEANDNGEESTYGMLVGSAEDQGDTHANITIVGNLFYDNLDRNPLCRNVSQLELVNNWMSDFGTSGTRFDEETTANVIGNAWQRGPQSTAERPHLYLSVNEGSSAIYISSDNIGYDTDDSTEYTGSSLAHEGAVSDGSLALVQGTPVFSSTISSPLSGSAVPASVAANAGARPNGSLDSIDAAFVAAA